MQAFGKYQLVQKIGAGGMAEIFLARSLGAEGLEKTLVIKRIRPEYVERPRFVAMFIDEAKIAVSLNHPNVVQVYEFGRVGSDYFLAMEYVEGADLGRLLAAGRSRGVALGVSDALYIAIEVAKALDYAHRKRDPLGRPLGIVHRDVSPQNILISRDGGVKLVDFGIARASFASSDSPGEVKGKLSYMSPEQASGEEVDARSDVFSLGVVLWEMLVGRSLFPYTTQDDTLARVRAARLGEELQRQAGVPASLALIIEQALAREPASRPDGARELQVLMTRCLFGMGTVADSVTLANHLAEVEPYLTSGVGGMATPVTVAVGELRGTHPAVVNAYEGQGGQGATAVFQALTGAPGRAEGLEQELSGLGAGTRPGGEEARGGRRRRVERSESVLVCGDLQGFSALRGAVGSERWRQALLDTIRLVESIAFKNGAVVDRIGETGFTLLLGLPFSTENDAERAMELAQQLHEALDALNINLEQPLSLSIGVVQGTVVVEHIEEGAERRFGWSWDEATPGQGGLALAEALARAAMPHEVLLGGRVWRRVRRRYAAEAVQQVEAEVDGRPLSLATWRLMGPLSARELLQNVRHGYARLLGRELSLQSLREAFRQRQACGGVGGVLVEGEQGVGKSTLVHAFLAGLATRGSLPSQPRVVRGSAQLHDRDAAYGALVRVARELLELGPGADLRQARDRLLALGGPMAAAVGEEEARFVAHALASLIGVKVEENALERLELEDRRARLHSSLRTFLTWVAQGQLLVFALEDLHYADPASLEFLAEVLDGGGDASIFFVLTALPADAEALEGAPGRLRQAAGLVVEPLGELEPGPARELALGLLPEALAADAAVVDRLIQRSGGNPLYIHEIIELIAERQLLDPREVRRLLDAPDEEPLWLPTTVEGLVASRIDRLPAAPRGVLQRCGLLGRSFDVPLLEAICGEELPLLRCLEALGELEAAGFVERQRAAGEETDPGELPLEVWSFRNAVIMEVAAHGVVEPERGELHHRIAEQLLARHDALVKVDFAEVGRHLEAAGQPERAGEMFLMAAEAALDGAGVDACVRLVDKALARLELGGASYRSALELKERALSVVGSFKERQALLTELLGWLEAADAPRRRRLRTQLRMARLLYDQGELAAVEEQAAAILAEAEACGEAPSVGSAQRLLVMVYRDTGRREEALSLIDAAIANFEALGDVEGLWAALISRGITLRQGGAMTEALAAYERALSILAGRSFRRQEQTTRINMGLLYAGLGELDKALDSYNQALTSIRALGHLRDEGALLANMGHLYLLLGDCEAAERTLLRGVRLSRRAHDKLALADGLLSLGVVHLDRGRLRQATAMLKKGLRLAREIRNVYLEVHGLLALAEAALAENAPAERAWGLRLAFEAQERSAAAGLGWGQARGASLEAEGLRLQGALPEALARSAAAVALAHQGHGDGAELIWVRHARLLEALGQEGHEAARQEARARVQARAARIADEGLRRQFLRSRAVQLVLQG